MWFESTAAAPTAANRARSKKVVESRSQHPAGVFLFTLTTTLDELREELAKAAGFDTVESLALEQLHWKHETPANAGRKLLADEIGYKAMLKSIEAKRGNIVIFFYLPKPEPISAEEVGTSMQRLN